jgi:putative component of membrane protein insertase Oxa1/YidC/SpoIIIJ protein YidD
LTPARFSSLIPAVLLLVSMTVAPAARASSSPPSSFGAPWSVNSLAPVTPDAAKVEVPKARPRVEQTSVPTIFLLGAVKFYQVAISPADGSSCLLYPTCSGYSVLSLRKHGPILGFIMTSERVMRNHTGEYYPSIWKFGRWRNYDPVEANDFWFPSEVRKAEAAQAARAKELEGHR